MFPEGTRVVLHQESDAGPDDEAGTVEAFEGNGMYLVRIDEEMREAGDADGLREVSEDEMFAWIEHQETILDRIAAAFAEDLHGDINAPPLETLPKVRAALAIDLFEDDAVLPTREEIWTFVAGDINGDVPEIMKKVWPATHKALEEIAG